MGFENDDEALADGCETTQEIDDERKLSLQQEKEWMESAAKHTLHDLPSTQSVDETSASSASIPMKVINHHKTSHPRVSVTYSVSIT